MVKTNQKKWLSRRVDLLIHAQARPPQARHQGFTYESMSWKAAGAFVLGSSPAIAEAEWFGGS